MFNVFLAYKTQSVYLEEENFATWAEDYWWVIALALIAIGAIAVWMRGVPRRGGGSLPQYEFAEVPLRRKMSAAYSPLSCASLGHPPS